MKTPRKRGAIWRRLRIRFLKEHPTCFYCGDTADTIDHIIPLAHGGDEMDLGNWRASCKACNSARGSRGRPANPTSRRW